MTDFVQLIGLVKEGAASLVVVKGAQIYVHVRSKSFCPKTGKEGAECRDVFSLQDIVKFYTKAKEQRLQIQSVENALGEIMEAAISADREGDAAKGLSKNDMKSAIKIAIESVSEK
jgi:hypothetical protein